MLADKGDVHITTTGGINDIGEGDLFNLQVVGSPLRGLGVIGGFSRYSHKSDIATLGDLGLGIYRKLTEGSTGKKLIVETYGGVSLANIRTDVNMDLTRYFIQPGLTFKSYYFDTSIQIRYSGLQYRNFDANGHNEAYLIEKSLIYDNGTRIDDQFYVFVEPALTIRGGYKFIKAQLQVAHSGTSYYIPWYYKSSTVTLGFALDIEEFWQFKKLR